MSLSDNVLPPDDELPEPDELDEALDYEAIVEGSEADRLAGRMYSHEEIAAWGAKRVEELLARRRSA